MLFPVRWRKEGDADDKRRKHKNRQRAKNNFRVKEVKKERPGIAVPSHQGRRNKREEKNAKRRDKKERTGRRGVSLLFDLRNGME